MLPFELEQLPRLPEVIYRLGCGEEDAARYVALLHACQYADALDPFSTLERLPTVEDMAAHFASLDPQPILVALARGHMIGCVRTTWWEEEDGTWLFLHLGRIRPEWRGYGLGTAFVRWAEQRLRAQASGYPTNGRGTFGANASSTETAATELLLNEGYTVSSTSAQMERTAFTPLPGPQVPEGFALRTAAAEHSRALWEAGRRHWAGLDPRHQPANRGRLPGIPQPDHPRPRPVDGRLA